METKRPPFGGGPGAKTTNPRSWTMTPPPAFGTDSMPTKTVTRPNSAPLSGVGTSMGPMLSRMAPQDLRRFNGGVRTVNNPGTGSVLRTVVAIDSSATELRVNGLPDYPNASRGYSKPSMNHMKDGSSSSLKRDSDPHVVGTFDELPGEDQELTQGSRRQDQTSHVVIQGLAAPPRLLAPPPRVAASALYRRAEPVRRAASAGGTITTAIPAVARNALADWKTMVASAKRSGRMDLEGTAQYAIATLWLDLGRYSKSAKAAAAFLRSAVARDDPASTAAALNVLGAVHHSAGDAQVSGKVPRKSNKENERDGQDTPQLVSRDGLVDFATASVTDLYRVAAKYHAAHAEAATTQASKIVALSNLGSVLSMLGNIPECCKALREAQSFAQDLNPLHPNVTRVYGTSKAFEAARHRLGQQAELAATLYALAVAKGELSVPSDPRVLAPTTRIQDYVVECSGQDWFEEDDDPESWSDVDSFADELDLSLPGSPTSTWMDSPSSEWDADQQAQSVPPTPAALPASSDPSEAMPKPRRAGLGARLRATARARAASAPLPVSKTVPRVEAEPLPEIDAEAEEPAMVSAPPPRFGCASTREYMVAESASLQAVTLARESRDVNALITSLRALGKLYMENGEHDLCLETFEEIASLESGPRQAGGPQAGTRPEDKNIAIAIALGNMELDQRMQEAAKKMQNQLEAASREADEAVAAKFAPKQAMSRSSTYSSMGGYQSEGDANQTGIEITVDEGSDQSGDESPEVLDNGGLTPTRVPSAKRLASSHSRAGNHADIFNTEMEETEEPDHLPFSLSSDVKMLLSL